jgi:hypothetical protein
MDIFWATGQKSSGNAERKELKYKRAESIILAQRDD